MIDDVTITELIEQQIRSAVQQKVDQLINTSNWIEQLENRTIDMVQQRIVSKFSNLDTVPELIDTIKTSVGNLFDQGRIPDLSSLIDPAAIERTVDIAVQELVKQTIDNLIVDPAWIEKIENIVNLNMSSKLSRTLSGFDMNQLIKEQIDSGIERWQDRLVENFSTRGITDRSTETQLTIIDGAVVVENELVSRQLLVDTDATVNGTLVVDTLVLKGRINTDNRSWSELSRVIADQVLVSVTDSWKSQLVDAVFDRASSSGIDFDSITVHGAELVTQHQLNNSITDTNIQKTGTLRELTVSGPTRLANTATVKNRRVGINTEDPEMALSIWDEEVAIALGKMSDKKAFIGTARAQDLAIGVNRKPAITIDTDGLTTINHLRLDRFKIGHAVEVPGYSGTRGDFVFNSDPKPNTAFAWVCLGGFKWQPLRSA